ncbi:MAG: DUF4430 domain-containing protein [Clostridia bacterium]|nr:DUF4430 domain-containing protein [Clostridia bacterium]
MKKLTTLTLCFAVLTLMLFTGCQNPSEHTTTTTSTGESSATVTLTIRCDTIENRENYSHIPNDGVILGATEYAIEQGDSAYDLICKAAEEENLIVATDGDPASPYITGISNIFGGDFGELSGWLFYVNGESPSVGCADYTLCDGDSVEWLYTCNMGEDLS